MKTVKSLEESSLLIKGVSQTIKKWSKRTKKWFLSMLLGILGASSSGNILKGNSTIRAGEGTFRVG